MNSNWVKFYPVELPGKIRVLPENYPDIKSGYIPENYPELKKKKIGMLFTRVLPGIYPKKIWNAFYPIFTRINYIFHNIF